MNHLKVKGPRKSLGAYIAGPYQFREIFKNLREKNYAVENELGPVWIRSIFGGLDKYHGFMKYFGFRVPRSVWMQQILCVLFVWAGLAYKSWLKVPLSGLM